MDYGSKKLKEVINLIDGMSDVEFNSLCDRADEDVRLFLDNSLLSEGHLVQREEVVSIEEASDEFYKFRSQLINKIFTSNTKWDCPTNVITADDYDYALAA